MKSDSPKFDLQKTVLRVVPNVIFTMLEIRALPTQTSRDPEINRVSAIIGFGGDTINGMIYLHFPESFGHVIAGKLLDVELGRAANDREINDAVGELCNMISGGLRAVLADAGFDTGMSPPSIIRGKGFTIESQPDFEITHFHFACDQDVLDLEVHLKL